MTNWLRRKLCLHTALFCVLNHVRTTTVARERILSLHLSAHEGLSSLFFVSPSGLSHVGKKSRQWKQRTSEHRSSIKRKRWRQPNSSTSERLQTGSPVVQVPGNRKRLQERGTGWNGRYVDWIDETDPMACHALISVFKVLHSFKWLVKHQCKWN